ncbi:hypothetical protein ON010_g9939 [Phytophthora cinnamomi]|nr:hypothetical protein ON010_g9939 [Phytophthora cinnamomi]
MRVSYTILTVIAVLASVSTESEATGLGLVKLSRTKIYEDEEGAEDEERSLDILTEKLGGLLETEEGEQNDPH